VGWAPTVAAGVSPTVKSAVFGRADGVATQPAKRIRRESLSTLPFGGPCLIRPVGKVGGMSLLHTTLEHLRDPFGKLAKRARVDARSVEEPVLDPEEVTSANWPLLVLIEGCNTLYRWPNDLRVVVYRACFLGGHNDG
jgi:hypothetical protein